MAGTWFRTFFTPRRLLLGASAGSLITLPLASFAYAEVEEKRRNSLISITPGQNQVYDVAVIGGGLAGLAVTRECAVRGKSVVLLEKEGELAAGASSGNSGLGHTGYDAPVGGLERKLLRRSIQLHRNLYRTFGLSIDHVRKSGSLVVAWTPEQLEKLPGIVEENRNAGDEGAELLTREELRKIEPSLSREALGAVFCPYEAVVEPWLVPMGYAESARMHGADISLGTEVKGANFDDNNRLWELYVAHHEEQKKKIEWPVKARVVINCAGLYGDLVEKFRIGEHTDESPEFKITPRKGQFLVFKPTEELTDSIPQFIIEPTPSEFTKGVIVWTTVYGNIIVGPTAVDQDSRTDRSTDAETLQKLKEYGEKAVPSLKNAVVIGSYSGLRPSCEHRDYQIKSFPESNWISVGAIRSTGLSAASGIGEYVFSLYESLGKIEQMEISNDKTENNLLGVSEAVTKPLAQRSDIINLPKVPSLKDLASDYSTSKDGCVMLYGRRQRVTHPISYFGMDNFTEWE